MSDPNIDNMDNDANGMVMNARARYTNILLMYSHSTSPSASGFIGRCNRCLTATRVVCTRCGDYYCSDTCQRWAWSRDHKLHCFRMPPLVTIVRNAGYTPKPDLSIPPLINGLLLLGIDPKSFNIVKQSDKRPLVVQPQQKPYNEDNIAPVPSGGNFVIPADLSRVILMRFASTQLVVVRSFPDENSLLPLTYEQVLAKVNDCGRVAPSLTSKPQINDSVLVVRKGKYCRGAVQYELSDMTFGILLIDYEKFGIFAMDALRVSSDEINQLPRFAVIMSLSNVPDKIRTPQFKEYFKNRPTIFTIFYTDADAVGVGADVSLVYTPAKKVLNALIFYYLRIETVQEVPTEEEKP